MPIAICKSFLVNDDTLVFASSAASAKTSQELKSEYCASPLSIHPEIEMLLLLQVSGFFR